MTGDFTYATELVELVHEVNGFAVGVAAFPELHPRSPDRATDRQRLAEKLALADFGMTQFFFEVEHYKRMVDELADLGCEVPVIPGVMPFVSVPGTRRMAGINNTEIPDWLNERWTPSTATPRPPASWASRSPPTWWPSCSTTASPASTCTR